MSGGSDYAGKPRPAVIVQGDLFTETGSVVVCSFTSDLRDAGLFRLGIEPTLSNGLAVPSRVMIDKIAAIPRAKLGRRIGVLDEESMRQINNALILFLELVDSSFYDGR